jgi:dienelactone hydrolase
MTDAKCQHCFSGDLNHSGCSSGSEGKLGGVDCYFAKPAEPTDRAVIIYTDVFGWKFKNTRLIADKIAAAGFLCVVPDILGGDAIPVDNFDRSTIPAWIGRHGDDVTLPPVEAATKALKTELGMRKVAASGYCFGARPAVLVGRGDAPLVDAVALAHPSLLKPEDFGTLRVPAVFQCAAMDNQVPPDTAIPAAKAAMDAAGVTYEFHGPYPGTEHGFAVRGAEKDPKVAAAAADALAATIAFCKKHLA